MSLLLTAVLGNQWARLAVGITLAFAIGLTAGIVKGMGISNAEQWQKHAAALELASKKKDEIITADARRAEADQADIEKRDGLIESLLHETSAPICTFSEPVLVKLRGIAASGR
jgi:hypothetical protein